MENFKKIKELVAQVETDAVKFDEMVSRAACTGVGKGRRELRSLAKKIREKVTEMKNTI